MTVADTDVRRRPNPILSPWVESLWYSAELGEGRVQERLLPRGTVELLIELGDERPAIIGERSSVQISNQVLVPALSAPLLLDRPAAHETIGVVFRPGGIAALIGLPADALDGHPVPLDQLWGRRAEELYERVARCAGVGPKLACVERYLTAIADRAAPGKRNSLAVAAAARIAAAPESCRIEELSSQLALSRRRLEEIFRPAVGITPKVFQRLWRFRRTLMRMHDGSVADWSAFAIDGGYYDHAHLINEFREFAGTTPSAYFASRGPNLNHLPLRATG